MSKMDELQAALTRWKPEERNSEYGTKDYAYVVVPPDVKQILANSSDLLAAVYQHMADAGFEALKYPVSETSNMALCWRRHPKV